MDYYNKIEEALERLLQWYTHKQFYSVSVTFKIEILDEYQDIDDILIPHMRIHALTNERNELIDLRLLLGLFFDGEDESKSKLIYGEIMSSRFGFLFEAESASRYNLSASLGNDVKKASAIILYFIRLFSKSKEIDIRPLYYCPMVLDGNFSLLQCRTEIKNSVSIKNLIETMFNRTRTDCESFHFDVLKDSRGDNEFLGEVTINKWNDGEGYTAWLRTGEINLHFLDAMFQRFLVFQNKYCAKEFNIQDNSLDVRVEFYENQIAELIYFISDCLHMFYPTLNREKIIAQLKYNYFSPVVQVYLTFYPDGKRPSDKELEYVYLLIDNLDYDIDEDEYFDPEIE